MSRSHSARIGSGSILRLGMVAFLFLFACALAPVSSMGQVGGARPGARPGDPTGGPSNARPTAPGDVKYVPSNADTVVDVRVEGNETVSPTAIFSQIKTRANRPFDPYVVQKDVAKLASKGWFLDVEPRYQKVAGGRVVIFKVTERPKLRWVTYLGNDSVKRSAIDKETGLKVDQALDPYAVDEGRRRIEEYYRSKGYNDAEVTIREGNEPTDLGVTYIINEGKRQKIWSVEFIGNTIVSDARLKTQIQSKPGFLKYFKGEVNRQQIDEDVDRLTNYYRGLGYLQAKVGRDLTFDEKGWMTLRFMIREGPRFTVRNISFIGNEKFDSETLGSLLKLKQGDFFSRDKLNEDTAALRDLYGSQGYVFADVQPDPRYLEDPSQLDLIYDVSEGKLYRVGEIHVNISGDNPHTQIRTALNRISLKPGDIIDITKIRKDEIRVRRADIFNTRPDQGTVPKISLKAPEIDETQIARPPTTGGGFRGQSPDTAPRMTPATRRADPLPPRVPMGDRSKLIIRGQSATPQWQAPASQRPAPSATAPLSTAPARPSKTIRSWVSPERQKINAQRRLPPNPAPQNAGPSDMARASVAPSNVAPSNVAPPNVAQSNVAHARQIQSQRAPSRPKRSGVTYRAQSPTAVTPFGTMYGDSEHRYGGQTVGSVGPNEAYAQPVTRVYGSPASAPPPYPGAVNHSAPNRPAYPSGASAPGTQPAGQVYPVNQPPSNSGPHGSVFRTPNYPLSTQPGGGGTMGPPVYSSSMTTDPSGQFNGLPDLYNGGIPDPTSDLIIDVAETQTGRFMAGVGVNSDAGLVGNISISEKNFDIWRFPTTFQDIRNGTAWRGAGQSFRIEALPGTEVQRYMVNFAEPYLFGSPISFGISGFLYDRRFTDWDEERIGGRLSLGYQLSPDLSTSATFRGERVRLSDPRVSTLGTVPDEVARSVGNNELFGFKGTLIHDTRDSQFLATTGHFIELGFEQVIGTYQYPRAEFNFRQYFLMRERPDQSGRHVLSLTSRVGVTGDDTPVYDNFFAGGFSTLRGWEFRGASPTVGGVVVGGEFQWINSAEYLFPLTADDMLRGVVFCDFGTVEPDVDINDFRVAPGVGLRVTVPALGPAPIALDFAFPVLKADTDDTQIFSFNIGLQR